MGSLFFIRTYTIIGGDGMSILMIYLNVSCIMIWHEFIFRKKRVKKEIREAFEDTGISPEDVKEKYLLILSILTIITALICVLPYNVYLTVKRFR